ncbi:MAG TPA: hypothetical protein PKX00_13030 [Opitutaceae bacterium]|nr:hypothetical protein [Opitutaceae bacterium]
MKLRVEFLDPCRVTLPAIRHPDGTVVLADHRLLAEPEQTVVDGAFLRDRAKTWRAALPLEDSAFAALDPLR